MSPPPGTLPGLAPDDDEFSAPLRRVLDPPTPVLVDLNVVLVPEPGFRRVAVSMRTETPASTPLPPCPACSMPGAGSVTGGWIGYVRPAIPTGNRGSYVETRQWRPAHALTRNEALEL